MAATGDQGGAVAILRLSGPDAVAVAGNIFRPSGSRTCLQLWQPESHRIYHGHILDSEGRLVDEASLCRCLQRRLPNTLFYDHLRVRCWAHPGARPGYARPALVHRGRCGGSALPRRTSVRAPRPSLLPGCGGPPGAPRRVHLARVPQWAP